MTEKIYFITEIRDDEARLYEPQYLNGEGLPKDQWIHKELWVDQNRVHADQDGVFVREEKIDGEIHYRQCPPPRSEEDEQWLNSPPVGREVI